MKHMLIAVFGTVLLALPLAAQVGPARPMVRASGEGSISVRPDQVRVTATVSVQAGTAQEATENTATGITNVM